jgi:hypothetical protein
VWCRTTAAIGPTASALQRPRVTVNRPPDTRSRVIKLGGFLYDSSSLGFFCTPRVCVKIPRCGFMVCACARFRIHGSRCTCESHACSSTVPPNMAKLYYAWNNQCGPSAPPASTPSIHAMSRFRTDQPAAYEGVVRIKIRSLLTDPLWTRCLEIRP